MEVRIFMGDKELKEDEIKNYVCISKVVQNTVNEVYEEYCKRRAEEQKQEDKK